MKLFVDQTEVSAPPAEWQFQRIEDYFAGLLALLT